MRSSIAGALRNRRRTYRLWTMAAALFLAAFFLCGALVDSALCYAVYLNGEEVGAARSIADVTKVVESAEAQLTEILGYEYSLDDALSVTANIGMPQKAPGELEKTLITSVAAVAEMYVLTIDDEPVAACEDETVLRTVLSRILEENSTEATSYVRFVSDVAVTRQIVSRDLEYTTAEIWALVSERLSVENTESILMSLPVPYDTEYIEDSELYEGESAVIIPGEPGVMMLTENTIYIDGAEQSRETIGEVTMQAPVTKIVAIGTTARPATASYGEYAWPDRKSTRLNSSH